MHSFGDTFPRIRHDRASTLEACSESASSLTIHMALRLHSAPSVGGSRIPRVCASMACSAYESRCAYDNNSLRMSRRRICALSMDSTRLTLATTDKYRIVPQPSDTTKSRVTTSHPDAIDRSSPDPPQPTVVSRQSAAIMDRGCSVTAGTTVASSGAARILFFCPAYQNAAPAPRLPRPRRPPTPKPQPTARLITDSTGRRAFLRSPAPLRTAAQSPPQPPQPPPTCAQGHRRNRSELSGCSGSSRSRAPLRQHARRASKRTVPPISSPVHLVHIQR